MPSASCALPRVRPRNRFQRVGYVEPFLCGALVRKFKLRHYQRDACLSYAAVQLLIALPLYLLVLPRDTEQLTANAARTDPAATTPGRSPKLGTMVVLAMTLTVAAVISSTLSVHLLTILQSNGMALAAAVGLGPLVGPSQVGARAIEMIVARYHHPIWTKFASVTFVAIGVSALWAGLPIIPLALAFYGAGIGLESIARGTLPLALFGPSGYAKLMGGLLPSLLAQAAAPSVGALMLERAGAQSMLAALSRLALINVVLACGLGWLVMRRRPLPTKAQSSLTDTNLTQLH